MTRPDENQTDLLLLAFRYVSGEMPEAECAAFEQRLEADQPAREAVARAVQVAQAIASTDPQRTRPAVSGHRSSSRRTFWASVAAATAAAVLAGVAVSHWFQADSSPSDPGTFQQARGTQAGSDAVGKSSLDESHRSDRLPLGTRPNGGDHRLLALWSAAETEFGQLFDNLTAEDASDQFAADAAEHELAMAPFEAGENAEFTVPDWMLAAVSSEDEPENEGTDEAPREN